MSNLPGWGNETILNDRYRRCDLGAECDARDVHKPSALHYHAVHWRNLFAKRDAEALADRRGRTVGGDSQISP